MLRVLSLSTRYPNDARPNYGNFVHLQNRALAACAGVEVRVVAPVGLPPYPFAWRHPGLRAVPVEEVREGIRIDHPRYTYWPKFPARTPRTLVRSLLPLLRGIRSEYPFDVLSAEFFWPEGPAAIELGRRLGVPVTIKARGIDFDGPTIGLAARHRLLEAGRGADLLLAISGDMKARMVAAGLANDRIVVHHPGIDRTIFRPSDRAAAKAALGLHGPVLLAVGNLVPRKGQRLAIEALARIAGATLLIVGSGPDGRVLQRLAADLGVAGRVRFLGSLPHAMLPAVFAAADVTIHASAMEGLANVRLESLACGTPVVTTATGDGAVLIDRPEAGRIVPAEPAAIAAAVCALLHAPADQATVRASTDRFSWERNAEELAFHLHSIATSRTGRGSARN